MRPQTLEEAAAKVLARAIRTDSGCWVWPGAASRGYGHVNVTGRKRKVHAVIYETHVGPIPEGLEIDHTCFNTLCVNPEHLEPVTHQENVRRTWAAGRHSGAEQRTHCRRGHALTPDNIYVSGPQRQCRRCSLNSRRRARTA